ncbi:LysR family transcriptional regulator ArgP [Novosphingobium flavum]|uniref:LysR family transcriptional regulator ArgP n=1 Tax=Novosphingobium flavum TaxID=1778672 RepID=A0A7X1FSK6_9SPHN|nr:LysR family transcriptional regulator ArgP [Novosphingobium flavum]MBC2666084.1 LysR family transcriptional regulator ArgP [Novosphingobium flavum]
MLDYPALRAVAAVAQTGSFEAAARQLNVTPSAISQRIKNLETRLGFYVIERGNPCVATPKGDWLCRHVEQVGLLESDLLSRLPILQPATGAQRLTLHVAVNSDSLATWFMPAAAAYAEASGHLLHLEVDEESQTAEWLAHGRVSAAVTSRETPIPGCRRFALGTMRYFAVASPAFKARYFPDGPSAEAFSAAPALTFSRHDQLQSRWLAGVLDDAPACPSHWLPTTQGFLDASLTGMGWGMNPLAMVEEHLAAGKLVELVPGRPFDVPLFWQVNRLAADHIQPLSEAVIRAAGAVLSPG